MKKLLTLFLIFFSVYGFGQTTTTKSIDSYSIYPGDLSDFKFYGSKGGKAYNVLGSMIKGDTSAIGQSLRSWVLAQGFSTGSSLVSGFNGRIGAVVPQSGDYAAYYAALVHTHTVANVTGLQSFLDAKSDIGHAHPIGEVTNLSTTLSTFLTSSLAASTYQPLGSYALSSHAHTFSSITSKPTTLGGYGITDGLTQAQSDALYSALIHTHTIANITNLQAALNAKADTTDLNNRVIAVGKTFKINPDSSFDVREDTVAFLTKVKADSIVAANRAGTLSSLSTTAKGNLVAAINEVNSKTVPVEFKEEFTSLSTTTKTLAHAPLYPLATLLFYDGVIQRSTWYSISGTTLTLTFTPDPTKNFILFYKY